MLLVDFTDTSGHIRSRNPEEFLDCFIILIEVLKVHHAQQLLLKKEFEALHNLKEIMAPILRGLRLGNGSLTRAHGGDTGSMRLIDKYLVDANVKRATAVNNVLGFERITAGRLILIVDCSKPDSSSDAVSPHASCLSFELSSGLRPIFVNCGPGGRFGTAFKRYCRSTQAHNTCSLGDISQAQFEFVSRKKKMA